jgi:ATP-dependent DNA helicase DinG
LLVIDKLPFAPPDDPLQEAKAERLQSAGKNAFKELHLPQAAVALKQGAGRLIRRETDRGVLVVCDVRLQQKSYGKKLLAALPAMRRLESPSQWIEALEALTTSSTTDPYWSLPPW